MTTPQGQKYCIGCRKVKNSFAFSKVQLKKPVAKCSSCILNDNPKATPAGGERTKPKIQSPVPVKRNDSPFDIHTIEVIDILHREGKMRKFTPLIGLLAPEKRKCMGCDRLSEVKLFGETPESRVPLCKVCVKMNEKLDLPLDMTPEENKNLQIESNHKRISLALAECTEVGQMSFLVARHERFLQMAYEERGEQVRKYFGSLE